MYGRAREYCTRREILYHSIYINRIIVKQLMKLMFVEYHSLTVVILVNIFGLLLMAMLKQIGKMIHAIVFVILVMEAALLLLLATTIIVSQVQ